MVHRVRKSGGIPNKKRKRYFLKVSRPSSVSMLVYIDTASQVHNFAVIGSFGSDRNASNKLVEFFNMEQGRPQARKVVNEIDTKPLVQEQPQGHSTI